jgi:hypothetical protein
LSADDRLSLPFLVDEEDVLRRSRTVLDLLVARPYPFGHTGLARFDRRPLA